MIKTPLSTVIGGAFWTPGATIVAATPSQLIEKLFSNGEQGFWYDPNDLSTMFQDSAGTVPVTTVGQPVGLWLSKDKGLLLEDSKLANGDFSTTSSWILSGSTISGGLLDLSNQYASAEQVIALENNEVYVLEYTVNTSSGSPALFLSSAGFTLSSVALSAAVGSYKRYVVIKDKTKPFRFVQNTLGATLKIDNVSFRKVAGNHTYQNTSSMRPILRDAPRRIDFDAVDDKLTTSFPAPLTSATIVRAVPGVGAQILTGQSIPATYEDSTDHCGLIVINRALTPSETSAITAEFNKRAGV